MEQIGNALRFETRLLIRVNHVLSYVLLIFNLNSREIKRDKRLA
jgi:hypothetical protein